MKTDKRMGLSFAAAAAAVLIFLTGCYYMPGSAAGSAKVALGVKGVPPNLTSTALVVTAPGMDTISVTAPTTSGSITVSVPAGSARTFTLLLNGPSATLEGVATVDLQPGENRQITVTPTVGATQIVIPDFQNNRIVQISDMNGTGWTEIKGPNLSSTINPTGGSFWPYAIDFDSLGRIYVASSTTVGLFRIDDINHPATPSAVLVDATLGITSLAIDRSRGYAYYGTGAVSLFLKDINSLTSLQPINLSSDNSNIIGTTSIAADDKGILYIIVYLLPLYTHQVIKYDPALPSGSRILATSAYNFTSPWGVMVKGPNVYVSDSSAGKIIRFDKNLQFVDSFAGPSGDQFYGPEAFVATLNRKITVIDEKSNFNDRLVSFDDMSGAGWTKFGTYGTGTNTFDFYSVC